MKDGITFLCMILFFLLWALSQSCNVFASEPHQPDTALWLARSCVGEAGFDSASSGECAAILSIYRKRLKPTGLSLYKVVRKYSAAIKPYHNRRHKWVMYLTRDLTQPKHWPEEKATWRRYRNRWQEMLVLCDDFMKGRIKDPLPQADHYGGVMDRINGVKEGWHMLKTDYRNDFWAIKKPKRKRTGEGMEKIEDLINVTEAAIALGVTETQFRLYARAGKFTTARKIRGTRWVVSRKEVEAIVSGKIDTDFSGTWDTVYGDKYAGKES